MNKTDLKNPIFLAGALMLFVGLMVWGQGIHKEQTASSAGGQMTMPASRMPDPQALGLILPEESPWPESDPSSAEPEKITAKTGSSAQEASLNEKIKQLESKGILIN